MYRQRLLRNIVVAKNQVLETTVSIYRKRSFDEIDFDDENKEESEILDKDERFFKKQSSLKKINNNDKDEKEKLIIEIR